MKATYLVWSPHRSSTNPDYTTGLWWGFYAGYIVTVFTGSIGTLLKKCERFVGIERRRVLYILVGLVTTTTVALVINLVLEPLVQLPKWAMRLGIYGVLVFVVMSALATGVFRREVESEGKSVEGK